ncbi:hypothetical protein JKY72_01070 [Candidatus Gracilibacteria bacterium]|nr:hypothetical protein [Candidatus Gracilibacteria bacterium]
MDSIKLFLNSNFFTSLVTLLVGSFAIGLYIKQKISFKRDSASLILQEIRYAEQQIRTAKEPTAAYSYALSTKLLPTNSWHENINLFIRELKETDIDLISRFYAKASYIDKTINMITDTKGPLPVLIGTPKVKAKAIPQENGEKNPTQEPLKQEEIIAMKYFVQFALEETTKEIEFIYNTPVVEKLRKIATEKKLFFF